MLDGVLPPGELLPSERDLMDTFQVGRSSIREALFALQRMGLVSLRNGERAYVTRPSAKALVSELAGAVRHLIAQPEGARELQEARALHEISLARFAAEHASDADIERLRIALEENRAALGNINEFTRTDVQFHLVLAEIPNNSIFVSLHLALADWLAEQRLTSLRVEHAEAAAFAAHEAIYTAVAGHDPDAAERAMREHLDAVGKYYWTRVESEDKRVR